jgi:hypothetical protein
MDERDGRSSYAIDLPDGGLSLIVGNVLQQGPKTENKTLVAYGAEQYRNPDRKLHVISNTLVNDAVAGGRFLFVRAGAPDAEIVNNIFSGPGTLPADSRNVHGNVRLPRSRFRDPDNFDFRLR